MTKNRNYPTILITSLLLFLWGCSNTEEKPENELYHVAVYNAFQQKSDVNVSEFSTGETEYILLDSEKEHLLAQNPYFYLSGDEIFAFAKQQIFVFNRQSGEFLREIGHYGNDPGGYKKVLRSFAFDEERQLVYTGGWDSKTYFRYAFDGRFLDKITAYTKEIEEDMMNNIFGEIVTSVAPLNDTTFVGYVWNIDGKQEAKLIVFNNNHRIKIFPQHKHFDYDIKRDGISVFSWNAKFYQLDHQLHFFERFTDTLFTVSIDSLRPKFVFHKGETENASATDYTEKDGGVPYLLIENVFESDRFLFFKVRKPEKDHNSAFYYGFFDKADRSIKISKNTQGFENDTDNFLPFTFISANRSNDLIGYLDAYEVKFWFDENPGKASKLPPHLQKLRNIKETDNPIIMIAKLKE